MDHITSISDAIAEAIAFCRFSASVLHQLLPLLLINQQAAEQRDGLAGNATPQFPGIDLSQATPKKWASQNKAHVFQGSLPDFLLKSIVHD